MNCPLSVRLSKDMPELNDLEEADRGTSLHEHAEDGLVSALTKGEEDFMFFTSTLRNEDNEAAQMVIDYVAFVGELEKAFKANCSKEELETVKRYVEETFELSKNVGGTADYLLSGIREGFKEVVVIDFKSGWEKVSAVDNPQLIIYALAHSITRWGTLPDKIRVRIFQPQDIGNPVKRETLLLPLILAWLEEIKTVENLAIDLSLKEEVTEDDIEVYVNPGDWCKYCKAKPKCPKLHAKLKNVGATMTKDLTQIPLPDLVEIFRNEEKLIGLIKSAGVYLKRLKEVGVDVPFTKLVETKGKRGWALTEKETADHLKKRGIKDPFKKKVIGIIDAEKALGKGAVDDLTVLPPVYTKLVCVEDPREALNVTKLIEDILDE